MADKNNMDSLLKTMALASLIMGSDTKEVELDVVNVKITATPIGLQGGIEANKGFIKDIPGAEEWFEETQKVLSPIICEQTSKLSKLMCKHFGVEMREVKADSFSDFLGKLFGGGVQKALIKNYSPSAIALSW